MKIYSRTGDSGTTGLRGGTRVSKGDDRIEAVGGLDELNAWLAMCSGKPLLSQCQGALFAIGAELAKPEDVCDPEGLTSLILALEADIDAMESELEPLRNFILPGGCERAKHFHIARTVCRRAERSAVRVGAGTESITFLNRLSDWLFVAARHANHEAGELDVTWAQRGTL